MKRKKKDNLIAILSILGVILLVLIFGLSDFPFSIISSNYQFFETLPNGESKSSMPYGSHLKLCYAGGCQYISPEEIYYLESDSCYSGGQPKHPDGYCGNDVVEFTNEFLNYGDDLIYSYFAQGSNARPNSIMNLETKSIIYETQNTFNTDTVREISFDYEVDFSRSGQLWYNPEPPMGVEFYLSSQTKDILLFEIGGVGGFSESGQVRITKNPLGTGYFLEHNNDQFNLEIPRGEYYILAKTETFNGESGFSSSSASIDISIRISSVQTSTEQECFTNSDCLEGFVCQDNKCVLEQEPQTESNTLYIILTILGVIFLISGLTYLYIKMRRQ